MIRAIWQLPSGKISFLFLSFITLLAILGPFRASLMPMRSIMIWMLCMVMRNWVCQSPSPTLRWPSMLAVPLR